VARVLSKLKLPRRLLASLVGAGGAAVLQVLAFALTSRALGPEAFGVLSIIFATGILFSPLGSLGADQTMVRTISRGTADFSRAWGHVLTVTALAFPVAWAAAVGVTLFTLQSVLPLWLIAAALAGEMLIGRVTSAGSAIFVAHDQMVQASVLEFGVVLLRALAAVLVFYLWGSTSLELWLGVIAVQSGLTALLAYVILTRRFGRPNFGVIRGDLGFGVLLMMNLFMMMAQNNLDRIILGQVASAREVGIYSAGTRLQLLGNMGNLWVARMYYPGYFKAALVVALVPPFAALQIPAADALTALDRQRLRTWVYAVALIILVVAIFVGVSALGMVGAAWALVATAAGTAMVLWGLFLKLVPDAA